MLKRDQTNGRKTRQTRANSEPKYILKKEKEEEPGSKIKEHKQKAPCGMVTNNIYKQKRSSLSYIFSFHFFLFEYFFALLHNALCLYSFSSLPSVPDLSFNMYFSCKSVCVCPVFKGWVAKCPSAPQPGARVAKARAAGPGFDPYPARFDLDDRRTSVRSCIATARRTFKTQG